VSDRFFKPLHQPQDPLDHVVAQVLAPREVEGDNALAGRGATRGATADAPRGHLHATVAQLALRDGHVPRALGLTRQVANSPVSAGTAITRMTVAAPPGVIPHHAPVVPVGAGVEVREVLVDHRHLLGDGTPLGLHGRLMSGAHRLAVHATRGSPTTTVTVRSAPCAVHVTAVLIEELATPVNANVRERHLSRFGPLSVAYFLREYISDNFLESERFFRALDSVQDLLDDVVAQVLAPREVEGDNALAGRGAVALKALPPKVLGVLGQLGDLVELGGYDREDVLYAVIGVAHHRVALEQLDARNELIVVVLGVAEVREIRGIRRKLNLVHKHIGREWYRIRHPIGVETESGTGFFCL